jgi:hypothetical protein
MICQSWKVMFQAEYSSGQPLRMLVDLRASVETALGGGKASDGKGQPKPSGENKAGAGATVKPNSAAAAKLGLKPVAAQAASTNQPSKTAPNRAAGKAPVVAGAAPVAAKPPATSPTPAKSKAAHADAPEFEVSGVPGWDNDPESEAKG